ncbi:MAG TPA: BREX system ATP-binding domain-containing protein, partial [Candidatus Hodarchaeales archaeon]|nr:BREX system ATP-binding domain-containing protein [Candidatus Hodarchaeales archaeon]
MPRTNEINQLLLTSRNPFTDVIVRSAWDTIVDVEAINSHITNKVRELLKEIRDYHHTQVFLVQGEPGLGKTHVISRLRKISESENFLFVSITPITDLTGSFNHIYREIFASLRKKKDEEKYIPMDRLISKIVADKLIKSIKEKARTQTLSSRILNLMDELRKDSTIFFRLLERDPNSIGVFKSFIDHAIKLVQAEYPETD